jgi:hypothetical protein
VPIRRQRTCGAVRVGCHQQARRPAMFVAASHQPSDLSSDRTNARSLRRERRERCGWTSMERTKRSDVAGRCWRFDCKWLKGAPAVTRFLTQNRDRRVPGLLVIPTDTHLVLMLFRCESRSGFVVTMCHKTSRSRSM